MPRDRSPESTLAFVRQGYRFVSRRCERHQSDVFETRLLLERTICLRGREPARLFYDAERFRRHGAAPGRMQRTLVGVGGVQGLDGEAHRARKHLLMSVMAPASVQRLADGFGDEWRRRLDRWASMDRLVLYDEVGQLLTRAVCGWAGVPLPEPEVRTRTRDLHAMIEGPATVGPRYWRGRLGRIRAERWIGDLVAGVRDARLPAPEGSPLRIITDARDEHGEPLDRREAAIALLNLLRPTVAVDRFVTFAALALHEHPGWRERLRTDDGAVEPFVQEVRRFYPFFPVVAARVRSGFDWHGFHFPRGRRVLLDLYGTNHDPRLWPEPDEFRPERFLGWTGDPFSLIPQGGGDPFAGHRCAGEWITIALMRTAVTALSRWMTYRVPAQDLGVGLRRMPALPRSRFVIAEVRPVPAPAARPRP